MGAPVEPKKGVKEVKKPPPTVDSIRAETLTEHRYVTRHVEDGHPDVVMVCACGHDEEAGNIEALAVKIEDHLDKAIRRAFNSTPFEGQRGTNQLRGFEKRVHDSLR